MKLGVVLVLGALALAGCINAAPSPGPLHEASIVPPPSDHALRLATSDCNEAGGQSTYNLAGFSDVLPKPWRPADVRDDVGNPVVLSTEVNTGGGLAGIYHATFLCKTYDLDGQAGSDLMMGFVGVRVEPPPFDPGGADKQYLVSVFTAGNEDVHHALMDMGFELHTGKGIIEPLGAFLHQQLDDEMHGVYDTRFVPKDVGPAKGGVTRLWLIVGSEHHDHAAAAAPGNGGGSFYHPIAIDMANTGGEHLVAEQGEAAFTHLRTDDHGVVPGAAGNVAAQAWMGFDRVLTMGPMPDVMLEQTWEHV